MDINWIGEKLAGLNGVIKLAQQRLNLPPAKDLRALSELLENSLTLWKQNHSEFETMVAGESTKTFSRRTRNAFIDKLMNDYKDIHWQLVKYLPAIKREFILVDAFEKSNQAEFDQLARQLETVLKLPNNRH
ncbi:hypothetical protein BGZ97_001200 [Linnemannia gamsii]|uniref:Uncharacterized protein n=1 Tax=Linnemannia gamsii TaxID=64522 RepID=A0A9P6RJ87_9FUNG|nr:hypothetical protein BGZ97_001200 [Linnemannia gamsii]